MLKGTTPTLLFHGGDYESTQNIHIEDVFPVVFPFGIGGVQGPRENAVSPLECFKHYMRLSLPQTKRPDFILAVCSMYHSIKSFNTGFIICKSLLRGQTLAEQVSKLTADDITNAAKNVNMKIPSNGNTAAHFLKAVSTSCKPIGHSTEAAADARKKYFAMRDHFGTQSVFFTFSPCDECSFRVKLYATSGKVSKNV